MLIIALCRVCCANRNRRVSNLGPLHFPSLVLACHSDQRSGALKGLLLFGLTLRTHSQAYPRYLRYPYEYQSTETTCKSGTWLGAGTFVHVLFQCKLRYLPGYYRPPLLASFSAAGRASAYNTRTQPGRASLPYLKSLMHLESCYLKVIHVG